MLQEKDAQLAGSDAAINDAYAKGTEDGESKAWLVVHKVKHGRAPTDQGHAIRTLTESVADAAKTITAMAAGTAAAQEEHEREIARLQEEHERKIASVAQELADAIASTATAVSLAATLTTEQTSLVTLYNASQAAGQLSQAKETAALEQASALQIKVASLLARRDAAPPQPAGLYASLVVGGGTPRAYGGGTPRGVGGGTPRPGRASSVDSAEVISPYSLECAREARALRDEYELEASLTRKAHDAAKSAAAAVHASENDIPAAAGASFCEADSASAQAEMLRGEGASAAPLATLRT